MVRLIAAMVLSAVAAGEYEVAAFVADNGMSTITASPKLCGDRAVKVTVTADQTTTVSLKPCLLDPN